ncbi:MAG: hypothetical protein M8467_02710 [Anaerolineae bacterium]|nr:hypothetical protein [Anaerolineae bacterium]
MRSSIVLITLFSILVSCPAIPARASEDAAHYAGWALEAYPDLSGDDMLAMVQRLASHGANVAWIGHNNPGVVDPDKVEPGLSYAVYEAYLDAADPRHEAAAAVIAAQHRMLAACRRVGIRAVLPVGYQIQMGQRWNEAHPGHLRLDAQGRPLDIYGGGVSASFYSPLYRRDIEAYYRWLDAEFVVPYRDVILMLNLADEPLGGDYSAQAEAAFRAQTGFGFEQAGDDPSRQRLVGRFQSRYVVEYAIYSARLWASIRPGLPVTMSFDGAQARQTWTMPDVEALFRDTPSNFVVTFDAYPRDGLPHVALSDGDLAGLYLLGRSLGLYSARYDRPLWLWAAANSWGLSQASPDPGTVSDAVANGLYLALLVRQAAGDAGPGAASHLQGIVYWNYNVKEQGLYNDTHSTAYDVETMFARVSEALPRLRQLMGAPPAHPDVLILAPPARAHQEIGAQRAAVLLEVQPYQRLAILAKEGLDAAVVSSLEGWSLAGLRAVVVLSPAAGYLPASDLARLRAFLDGGGKVVASPDVGAALRELDAAPAELAYGGLVVRHGNLYVAQQGIAVLFEDRRHDVLAAFWQDCLGLNAVQPGYRLVTSRYALYYHIGSGPVTIEVDLPYEAYGYRYDDEGRAVERLHGSRLTVTLARREYILLRRDPWAWPWLV